MCAKGARNILLINWAGAWPDERVVFLKGKFDISVQLPYPQLEFNPGGQGYLPVWFTALFQVIVLLLEGFHEARPRLFLFACFWPVIMP